VIFTNETDGEDFPAVKYRSTDVNYNYERDTLRGAMPARTDTATDVHQALVAFRLIQRVHAEELLPEEFQIVRAVLEQTLRLAREKAATDEIRASARETVRLAADAQRLVREGGVARQADAVVSTKGGVFIK